VNVIIVDYRGLDTLGEIGVVLVAGLAILALVRIKPKNDKPHPPVTADKATGEAAE
jgi:multicomponent Na+:H+ antiporter subunit A